LKILHVVQNYYPSIGGTQIFFQNISERCVKDYGDEVEVFTVNSYFGPEKKQFKLIEPSAETVNGVSVQRFSFIRWHLVFIRFLVKVIAFITQAAPHYFSSVLHGPWSPGLAKAIKETNADVIVAATSQYDYIRYSLYRHKLKNPKPFVIQGAIHFYEDPAKKIFGNKTLQAIKQCDYYLSNTDFEKQWLTALGVAADKIVTVGVGVDMNMFIDGDRNYFREQLKIEDDETLIAYIGRIESTKSIDILLKAIPQVFEKNNKVKLVIAGYANDYLEVLRNIVAGFSEEYQQRIYFLTNLSAKRKIDLFHAIDILVLPSVSESFGMVFLEAWSCKKPVIGTSIGAVECVVTNEVDGLLALPKNVNDLAKKINQLSSDKSKQIELGINGFNKTSQLYTWEAVTKKYRDTYIRAIEKFKASA